MRNSNLIIFLIILGIIVSGCATIGKGNIYSKIGDSYHYRDYIIQIVSSPAGAKIEWNGKAMGAAPVKIKYNGTFFSDTSITLRAYPSPSGSGQYVQSKTILGTMVLPRKIFFDMNLKPTGIDKRIK